MYNRFSILENTQIHIHWERRSKEITNMIVIALSRDEYRT